MKNASLPLFLVALVLVTVAGWLYYRAHSSTMSATLRPTTVICAILVAILAVGLGTTCFSTHSPTESFVSDPHTGAMPECEWVAYVDKHTSRDEYSLRQATTQPTPATTQLLIQHAGSGEVLLPTRMSSNQLAYVLRVWVTAPNRDVLQNTNPFHIRYHQTGTTELDDIPTQYRIVEEQHVPYDGLVGTHWFLVESSAFRVPESATNVHWQLNATSVETHWCTFDVQNKRPTHDFEPTNGLQALYSTFLEGSNIHDKQWYDESGHDAVTSFTHAPKMNGKGVVIQHAWTGPSATLLVSNNDGQCSNSNNIRNFTLSFYYQAPTAEPTQQKPTQSSDVTQPTTTLFTIYGTYRNQQGHDNPPRYFLRCDLNATNQHLCFVQQHVPDERTGVYAEKTFYVPLRVHSEDPVLYTVVVHSNTRTSGNIDVYTNKKHETHLTKWLDLNYSLKAQDHIIWGDAHSIGKEARGILYMMALFNTALHQDQVKQLSKYVLHKYNTPTPPTQQQQQVYDYYVPTPSQGHGSQGEMCSSRTKEQPSNTNQASTLACVKYKPNAINKTMSCSYVAEQQCTKGVNADDGFYYYPVSNQGCNDAMRMVNVIQDDAQDMGMQWKGDDSVEGFTYRSQLTDDAYNKLTPQQKMNVLNDQTFLRTYRKI